MTVHKLSNHDQQVLDHIFQDQRDRPLTVPKTEISGREAEAVSLFESGAHQQAIDLLSSLITAHPDNPSPYNNRAQMYRLLKTNTDFAIKDCEKAIELSGDKEDLAGIKRSSLMQLGWIRMAVEGDEQAALPLFEQAAELGSVEGRRLAAKCNPYAAMCNQMLREMMSTYFSI